MITEISILLLTALFANFLFKKMQLPGILGMMLVGVLFGRSVFGFIGDDTFSFLKEFKTVALIVILIRAGLGINKATLHKIGKPAIKMSMIPVILEGITATLTAHYLFKLSFIEAGMLGFILSAVSPAVVIPTMLNFKELGFGKKREIPTLILAGASVDDVFAITLFSVFVNLAMGTSTQWYYFAFGVPGGILSAIGIGILIGLFLVWFFKQYKLRDTVKVIIFTCIAVLFHDISELDQLKKVIPIASLLGIMTIGFVLLEKYETVAHRMAKRFNKFWVLMEMLLFVYIGSEVQLEALNASLVGKGLLLICFGLMARSIGVVISLLNSELNTKERLFCVISYIPKATVQAAIGAIPLTLILEGKITGSTEQTGQTILSIAVLSIVFTAPIGAIGTKIGGPLLLDKD